MGYITYKNTYHSSIKHIITNVTVVHNGINYNTIALWDTGAQHTHISQHIIEALNLVSFGETNTIAYSGAVSAKKYKISIILPTHGLVNDITVLSATNLKMNDVDIGVLIGMDIIKCGDFHIDNVEDRIVFTFRHWSNSIDEDEIIETELF